MVRSTLYLLGLAVAGLFVAGGVYAGQGVRTEQKGNITVLDFRLPANLPFYPVAGRPKVVWHRGECREIPAAQQQRNSLLRLPARTLQTPPGVKIASTSYDWQTNFLIKNRTVWAASDNILQLVWMSGSGDPSGGWPDRGTYYGAVDLENPGNPQVMPTQRGWTRIEPSRTGWPAAAELPGGALAFMSHTPLRFGKNGGVLDENWTVAQIGPEGSLWPYMTSTPEGSLHVVYTYSSGPNAGQVGYLRSTDQGQTWSEEVFLSGADAPRAVAAADHYVIEYGGGKLVAGYYALLLERGPGIVLRISTDNGQSWSEPLGIFPGQFQLTHYVDSTVTTDTLRVTYFHTDTALGIDTYSMLVDAQGRFHILATIAGYYWQGQISDTLQPGGGVSGSDTSYTLAFGGVFPVAAYLLEGSSEPVLLALPTPVLDANGNLVRVVHARADGYVDRIKLGQDDEGKLYAVFIAPKEGDLVEVEGQTHGYGHLYVVAQVDDQTWGSPIDLSPDGIDCSFPTASKGGPAGYALIVYQAGTVPGSFVQGAPWAAGLDDDIYVYAYALPVGVRESTPEELFTLQVRPNPLTQSGYAQLKSSEPGWATVELYTPVGSKLRTLYEGWVNAHETRLLWVDVSELASGSYYLKLQLNGRSMLQPIIVVR